MFLKRSSSSDVKNSGEGIQNFVKETTKNSDVVAKESVEKAPYNANPVTLPVTMRPEKIFEGRTALIYRPTRNVMQSGTAQTKHWCIQLNSDVPRWENPLMGWTSSRDPMQAVSFKFPSRKDAVKFAQDQGWSFEVKEDEKPARRPKSYAENFSYSTGKLKLIKTK